jgi:hypothetical protein
VFLSLLPKFDHMALFRLLFAVFLVGVFITGFIYFIASIIGGIVFNPESRVWKEMLAKLRARIKSPQLLQAAPHDADTLSLLSLKPKITKKAGWRNPVFEGVYSTIYQEPVLFFAGQKSGKSAVLVARSSEREYVFRQKGKETEIWRDGQPYAVFVNNSLLAAGKQSRLLAQLEPDAELRQWPVLLGQGEAATLANAERVVSPIPRAFTLLRPVQPEEAEVLLVLAVMQGIKA